MPPINDTRFLFDVTELEQELRVVKFAANERISSPYEVNLTLASEAEANFDDVIGKEALLTILGDEAERYFHGIINRFTQSGSMGRFYLYEAKLAPSLWLLSMEHDCRIFQNKTVNEIVTQILEDRGITSEFFEFRLQSSYEPKEYCVQYRETDLSFISRLLEEEGIFYFFEHTSDKHLLVFGDGTVNYQPISAEARMVFNPGGGMVPEEESVYRFTLTRRILPGKVTLKDFNFERPSLDLTVQEQSDSFQQLEVYDYPGEYAAPENGRRLAQIRLQEAVTYKDRADGASNSHRFTSGYSFTLTDHDQAAFNQEYLLTEVHHAGTQPQVIEERASSGQGLSYANEFVGIPSSVCFRAGARTLKPVVEGVQTAIVVGVSGGEVYTDDAPYGMVKVQFHWDREGQRNEQSSCWLRVAYSYAGERHGVQFTPLIGDEVLVAFLEGDPDHPVVVGSFFKGDHRALMGQGDMIQNILLTPYQHKLLFNDKGASITLTTGGGQTVNMADGAETSANGNNVKISTSDGHSVHLAGGNSLNGIEIKTQGANFARFDDAANKVEIDSPGLVRLHQGDNNQHMDASATHIWRGENHISITDQSIHLWHGDYHVLVDSSQVKLYSGGNAVRLGPDMISITHQTKVQLTVGGSSVTLTPADVEVKGTMIKIEGQAVTEIKGTPVKINC